MEFSAKQIAAFIQGEIIGDENASVHTFAKIEEGIPGALSFLSNPKYTPYIYETKSSIVLVNRDFAPEQEVNATLIKVDNAYEALAKLMTMVEQSKPKKVGVDPLAYVAPTAKIGEGTYVAPFAYVGDHAVVGSNCVLHPNVTIYHDCRVGDNCILHAGCVIGADGFGFAPTPDGYEKIPQIGIVVLEDNVEIGANTCIDRATMGATIIHKGVKLDNLIQVAHNVEIGANTVSAAQSGVAGSTKIGEWCMIGGQVGFAGHIKVGNKVNIGAQSGILGNTKDGVSIMGSPATDVKQYMKMAAVSRRLPDIKQELDTLRKEVEELKQLLKNQQEK